MTICSVQSLECSRMARECKDVIVYLGLGLGRRKKCYIDDEESVQG